MRRLNAMLCALLVSGVQLVFAQDADSGASPWSGNVSVGYLRSSGNTEDSTADFDFDVLYTMKPWAHLLKGRAYGAKTDNETTSESYKLGWKSTYDFTASNYGYGALDWNKDRFAGYTRQTYATVGYGRRILATDVYVLNAEIGAGYARQRSAEVGDGMGGIVEPAATVDGATGTLGGNFTWKLSDNASFEQTLYLFAASENNFWESVTKLRAGLIGNVGMALSYTIKRNSEVPAGTEKIDTLTSIGLDYAF